MEIRNPFTFWCLQGKFTEVTDNSTYDLKAGFYLDSSGFKNPYGTYACTSTPDTEDETDMVKFVVSPLEGNRQNYKVNLTRKCLPLKSCDFQPQITYSTHPTKLCSEVLLSSSCGSRMMSWRCSMTRLGSSIKGCLPKMMDPVHMLARTRFLETWRRRGVVRVRCRSWGSRIGRFCIHGGSRILVCGGELLDLQLNCVCVGNFCKLWSKFQVK